MSYAIVVVEVDVGHEAHLRKEFEESEFAQVLAASRRPRDPRVRLHIRCREADSEAVLDQLHRCVRKGEIGRMRTRVCLGRERLRAGGA